MINFGGCPIQEGKTFGERALANQSLNYGQYLAD